ncbi:MAG: osmotically inducible protein C [marine bacterium B5-7]|nr:MAG: osmotically inducible protein C [marine bacterium B5-7]
MARIKFEFPNSEGNILAGLLETPADNTPVTHYALFAHCFTCGKDIAAASRISRALAQRGIAVLRFDFTGLGNSDGDFSNTNFSSNIEDIKSAVAALDEKYESPQLLIGHSLGGAAVLTVAADLPSVRAVVTIGAPATADHIEHLFAAQSDVLEEHGEARVKLGIREFTIKQQFVDDVRAHGDAEHIGKLRKALLVYHSPVDAVVSINEAARIYSAARHPKSFISLDKADHLLGRPQDAAYVAETMSAWVSRYLELGQMEDTTARPQNIHPGEIVVTEKDKKFLRGLYSPDHEMLADEPNSYGGSNLGPTPYDLLLMSLGACTSMTLRMYANRNDMALDDVEVRLAHERIHADDCSDCEGREGKLERITRTIRLEGDLDDTQRARLIKIADRCPVHKTLESQPVIVTHEEIKDV